MTSDQIALYDRLIEFSLDQPEAKLTFSQRLARENGWSMSFTRRVVFEYKRFAFLAVTAGHPVTPSDEVDQAWHLHLLYTRSYWDEFCGKVLQTPLHHGPTRGGQQESHKFHNWYAQTLASYERLFGEAPPADIWPPIHQRFHFANRFERVNLGRYWLIPKLQFSSHTAVTLLIATALFVIGCASMGPLSTFNVFNYTGAQFLAFYIFGLVIILAKLLLLRSKELGETSAAHATRSAPALDAYETAYLQNGANHALNTAIVQLMADEYVKLNSDQRLEANRALPTDRHRLERAIVAGLSKPKTLPDLQLSCQSALSAIESRLKNQGLLVKIEKIKDAIKWPTRALMIWFVIGVIKIVVGFFRDKPIGFLLVLVSITLGVMLYIIRRPQLVTRAGQSTLKNIRTKQQDFLNRSRQGEVLPGSDIGLAFALFGAPILIGEYLTGLDGFFGAQLYARPTASGFAEESGWGTSTAFARDSGSSGGESSGGESSGGESSGGDSSGGDSSGDSGGSGCGGCGGGSGD